MHRDEFKFDVTYPLTLRYILLCVYRVEDSPDSCTVGHTATVWVASDQKRCGRSTLQRIFNVLFTLCCAFVAEWANAFSTLGLRISGVNNLVGILDKGTTVEGD